MSHLDYSCIKLDSLLSGIAYQILDNIIIV